MNRVIAGSELWQPCHKVLRASRTRTRQSCKRALIAGEPELAVPFELLALQAEWTIVGSSPLSKAYQSRQEFLDKVITAFKPRMMKPLVPTVRGMLADGDMVVILFAAAATAKDGVAYRNTYTWYFQMKEDSVIKAIAFFDTRNFDEFWTRVSPLS
jgi:uncharacterized protein